MKRGSSNRQLIQSIKGSIYSYSGVVLGFVNSSVLFPHLLTTQQIGVLNLLVTYSLILSILGALGFTDVIYRLFPYFKDEKQSHNGLLSIILVLSVIGGGIATLLFEFLEPFLINTNEQSGLFIQYSFLVGPLTFATLLFSLLDAYNVVLGNAVTGNLLKDVVMKFAISISILLFLFIPQVNYQELVYLYSFSLVLPTILLIAFLKYKKTFLLGLKGRLLKKRMFRKIMLSVSSHGVLRGLGIVLSLRLDVIMINQMISEAAVGIYTTMYFISSVILIPSKILSKVFSKTLSEAFKENDFETIGRVYKQTSLILGTAGVYIGLGIMINLKNIEAFYPTEYSSAIWVIPFFCITNIVMVFVGVIDRIIQFSKHYKKSTLFMTLYLILLVITNLIFIPIYAVMGAALATFISTLIVYGIRVIFVYKKLNIQPFSRKHLVIILIGLFMLVVQSLIPQIAPFYLDIFVRSIFFTALFVGIVLKVRLIPEFNGIMANLLNKLDLRI